MEEMSRKGEKFWEPQCRHWPEVGCDPLESRSRPSIDSLQLHGELALAFKALSRRMAKVFESIFDFTFNWQDITTISRSQFGERISN